MAATEIPLADLKGPEYRSPELLEQEPHQVFQQVERWNAPRSNVWKTLATFWSFLVMGMNDSAYGVSYRFSIEGKWSL